MHKSIVRYEIFTLNYLEIKLKVKSDRHYQKKKKKKKEFEHFQIVQKCIELIKCTKKVKSGVQKDVFAEETKNTR